MSCFIFGDLEVISENQKYIKDAAAYCRQKGIYFWFNQEIDYYKDIFLMLEENASIPGSIKFGITSELQNKNSHDLLLPYDKYENSILFPEWDDKCENYSRLCKENLNIFQEAFNYFYKTINPIYVRVFVTEGYDQGFEVKQCDLEEMFEHLNSEALKGFFTSRIYQLNHVN